MSLADEVGGGLDGLSQLRMLMASGRKPGILVALDFVFVEVEAGKAVFEGTPGKHAYNPIGTVHGGYAATLLDSACGCAVHYWQPDEPRDPPDVVAEPCLGTDLGRKRR
jgi:acyl-coenzyme A thioesterase PaaI-like protein